METSDDVVQKAVRQYVKFASVHEFPDSKGNCGDQHDDHKCRQKRAAGDGYLQIGKPSGDVIALEHNFEMLFRRRPTYLKKFSIWGNAIVRPKLIAVCGAIGAYCRYAIHCPVTKTLIGGSPERTIVRPSPMLSGNIVG